MTDSNSNVDIVSMCIAMISSIAITLLITVRFVMPSYDVDPVVAPIKVLDPTAIDFVGLGVKENEIAEVIDRYKLFLTSQNQVVILSPSVFYAHDKYRVRTEDIKPFVNDKEESQ